MFAIGTLRADALTDNYLVLLAHFTRQGMVDVADVRAYLGVDEEYEDIDTA